MKKRRRAIIVCLLGMLSFAGVSLSWSQRQPSDDAAAQRAYEKIGKVSGALSDQEFDHLRMSLPAPVDKPWTGPFYNSTTYFNEDKKLAAVGVLPIWIRKAVIAGETDMAGRFLWSYIKLTEDKNLEVATKAVITLYRMGDCKAVALVKMRQWIESGLKCYYTDAVAETSDSKDIRQQILVELDFYKDRSLDETIHAVWSRNRNEEGKDVWSVDYGYYLEKHGKALPEEYWMRRLDSPYNFLSALEVIEVRKPAGWSEKLQAVFAELSTKRGPSPQASRARGYAARVASTLFRLSGKTDYLDYLVSRGESELVSEDFDSSLSNVLDGLAQTGDPVALKVVSGGMKHKNQVVREMVLHAMGLTQSPDATELLFQEAMNEAKMGLSFPNRQLRALLEQRTPLADVRYDQLKNALLGGHVAWTAVSSDFAHLEFFRKHRH